VVNVNKVNLKLEVRLILKDLQPTELSDDEWAEYLFMRKNIKGIQFERWNHAHGCRKWFNMVRDTSNDKIHGVYKMGEKPPMK
jgi:sarcosine oxidase subunit delta